MVSTVGVSPLPEVKEQQIRQLLPFNSTVKHLREFTAKEIVILMWSDPQADFKFIRLLDLKVRKLIYIF